MLSSTELSIIVILSKQGTLLSASKTDHKWRTFRLVSWCTFARVLTTIGTDNTNPIDGCITSLSTILAGLKRANINELYQKTFSLGRKTRLSAGSSEEWVSGDGLSMKVDISSKPYSYILTVVPENVKK